MAFSERVTRLKSSLIREILAAAQRPEVMSFAGGLPAASMLPAVDWTDMPPGIGQYGMSEGEPELREAIAAEARALGVDCQATQVLIVSGSQQTIDLVSKLFIDPGTEVLVEAPTYLAALQSFQLFGAHCIAVPQECDGPDLQVLRQKLEQQRPAFAYLIPTFQNPSAVRYSEAKRDAVAALFDEFGVTLLEDEPYRELVFDEGTATPIVSRLRTASWIYTGTLSKTLLPGLRIGFLIATPDLFPYLLRLKQAADLHTNRIGQWQALQWLGTERYRQHLAELRGFYRQRRDAMQQALLEHFAELADWEIPQGGLFFWLKLKPPQAGLQLDTRTLLKAALAQNVAFMPGEPFFIDPEANRGYLRLNFSHVEPQRLGEGLARLAVVIRSARDAQLEAAV
jgi:DNA-binding transcriptional MocR family regulator